MSNGTAALLDAIARGCGGGLVNEALRAHVLDGVDLEQALGLDRASRIRARNEALEAAARVLAPGAGSSWEVACRLAAAVRRFEVRVWPRCKGDPADLGPVDTALRLAFLSREKVPTSPRRLAMFVDTNAQQRPKLPGIVTASNQPE